jgi:hypothetical protein
MYVCMYIHTLHNFHFVQLFPCFFNTTPFLDELPCAEYLDVRTPYNLPTTSTPFRFAFGFPFLVSIRRVPRPRYLEEGS